MALSDIDTIVVVILENRSFDHVLGYLSLPDAPQPMPVDGLRADPAWLSAHANTHAGQAFESHRLAATQQAIPDPKHDHTAIALQINAASAGPGVTRMGGLVESYVRFADEPPPDPSAVMGYYDHTGVPVFDFLARHYAVCDHWFAGLPTGTQANRLIAMAGLSKVVDNGSVLLPDEDLVYDWLSRHKVPWCAYQYGDFFPFFSLNGRLLPEILTSISFSEAGGRGRFRRYHRFAKEWSSTKPMPNVIFIEPEYSDGPHKDPCDDHPPTGIAKGQAFIAGIYQTLISNPTRWAKTMMIITYDEHGGFFDHVEPLAIPTVVKGHHFETTGVRVPALVVSPQVAAGSVFNRPLDHTSILQLLADRFDPTHGYSVPVNARQGHLDRLKNILEPPQAVPRAPSIPIDLLDAIKTVAEASPVAPPLGASPTDPPNARAAHAVAMKALEEHPEIVAEPGWTSLQDYLDLI